MAMHMHDVLAYACASHKRCSHAPVILSTFTIRCMHAVVHASLLTGLALLCFSLRLLEEEARCTDPIGLNFLFYIRGGGFDFLLNLAK